MITLRSIHCRFPKPRRLHQWLLYRTFVTETKEENQHRLYETHIPTSCVQKAVLAVGSAITGLSDPWRADMVATCGEVTGSFALKSLHHKIQEDEEGARVLQERPRLNTTNVDFKHLKTLPLTTLGGAYVAYNEFWKITPDSRDEVHFVDNEELAYVMRRYREVHDLTHAVLDMPTNLVGEVAVKWVEALQTGLPMCIGGALLGPTRFTAKQARQFRRLRPWASRVGLQAKLFTSIYFEERWEQDLADFHREMNIEPPPSKWRR